MDFSKLKSKSFLLAFVLSLVFGGMIIKNPPNNILSWDIYGHYLYLPSTFIYDDPYYEKMETYEKLNEQYNNLDFFYILYETEDGSGRHYNKCTVGFSGLMAPFFAIGHWMTGFTDYPQDGFSKPYQYAISFGCWFYFVLGLFFLNAVLRKLFKEWLVIVLMLLVVLATNLGYYGVFGLGMVHGVLFGFYSMLLYFTIEWYRKPSIKNSVFLAICFGLMTLTRASEIISIMIPLFYGMKGISKEEIKKRLKFFRTNVKQVVIIGGIIVFIGSLQMIYWKLCTGSWIIDSYNNPGEGFDIFPPHLVDYLFSYRKGLLVYTPIMIFCLSGFYFLWKKRKDLFILVVFGILNILILSSWTCWWYAESFGQRSIVQSYPIYIIGLGFFIEAIRKYRVGSMVMVLLFSGLSIFHSFQFWQFTEGIIHPSRMTGAAYWASFLQTERPENLDDLLIVDDQQDPSICINDTINFQLESRVLIDYESDLPDDFKLSNSIEENCIEVNDEFIYSNMLTIPYEEVSDKQYSVFKVSASFLIEGDPSVTKVSLAFRIAHKDMYYQQYLVPHEIGEVIPGEWQTYSMTFFAPYIRSGKDNIEIFGWLMGQGRAYIDNVEIETYRRVNDYY